MMTGKTELILIKRLTKDKPLIPAMELEEELRRVNRILLNRHSDNLDLQLEAEIRKSEIRKISKLLEEIK